MTTGFVRARGGKSHSWLTPTTSRSKPSANRISVADGSNETTRIPRIYHTTKGPAIFSLSSRPERPGFFLRTVCVRRVAERRDRGKITAYALRTPAASLCARLPLRAYAYFAPHRYLFLVFADFVAVASYIKYFFR